MPLSHFNIGDKAGQSPKPLPPLNKEVAIARRRRAKEKAQKRLYGGLANVYNSDPVVVRIPKSP
jgi:hypothetical protein